MKRITVTLTEDQAKFLMRLMNETVLDEDGFTDEYTDAERAFAKRVRGLIAYGILNPRVNVT